MVIPSTQSLTYSNQFSDEDDDGVLQIDTEERIAQCLSESDEEDPEQFLTVLEIVDIVTREFAINVVPRLHIQAVFLALHTALGEWKEKLTQPEEGPNEDEAAEMGRDLLIVTLSILRPEWVTQKKETHETR